jgi:hypothetical protein
MNPEIHETLTSTILMLLTVKIWGYKIKKNQLEKQKAENTGFVE